MSKESVISAYREYLGGLPIQTLRMVGRKQGAPSRCFSSKGMLVNALVDLLTGDAKPEARSNRGAPVKQDYIDPNIIQAVISFRRQYEAETIEQASDYTGMLYVEQPERPQSFFEQATFSGILEILQGGYGFLRAENCQPGGNDVFVSAPQIHNLKLKEGDFVVCTATPRQKNESPALSTLLSVNGKLVGFYESRKGFDSLTSCYPNQKIQLSKAESAFSLRLIDLFCPIGRGQRGLIIAPPKAGKTTLLKEIATAITKDKTLKPIVLLIDERPEEVTDFKQSVPGAMIVSSTFDEASEHHIRSAEMVVSYAKRLAEVGENVVILLDSLTKLTRAYNTVSDNSGKTLSGGLEASAFLGPKRFFGAARNTAEGGSVTVLATVLVDTGSRMDDVIYEEFKGTGNADIFLSRELAERRVYPAIDLRRSGTRKEELLLSEEERNGSRLLREKGAADSTEAILSAMKKTKDNEEFLAKLHEWLKVYRGN